MGNAYTFSMPSGIPGAVNRVGGRGPDIEAVILDPNNLFAVYGLFGQIDSVTGLFRTLVAGDAAVYGPLVRPFPTQPTTASSYSGSVVLGAGGTPPTKGTAGVMKAGYMTVLLEPNNAGVVTNPAKNAAVYTCIQNANAAGHVGGIQGAADGGNTIAVAGAYFMGPADGSNNIEIAFNV